jgi:hypothetical protein
MTGKQLWELAEELSLDELNMLRESCPEINPSFFKSMVGPCDDILPLSDEEIQELKKDKENEEADSPNFAGVFGG